MADNHLIGTITMGEEIYGHLQNATLQGLSAYEVAVANGFTGTEAEWLSSLKGETGETPNIQVGNVSTGLPGTNASATMIGTKENPVLNITIPRGNVGATPNMTIGTVTTGEEGTQAQATITGTPEDPVLNLTIPKGDTGNDGFDPIVEVTKSGDTATLTVTDSTHTTEVNIVDGYTPQKNVDYFDGHSPKITGAKSQGTTFIYSDGEQIGTIADGQDGYTPRKGVDYFDGHTPAISGEKIDDTTFIYADGVRIATVLDGVDGRTPVITTVKSGKTTSILADSIVIGTVSDGADGHSPTITTTKSGKTTTIFADGTSIGTISDGQDGHSPEITTNKVGKVLSIMSDGQTIGTVSDGADAVAPTITTNKSGTTTTIYSNGVAIGTVEDGVDGYTPVVDQTPTDGSINAVSSGGVYDELEDIKDDLSQKYEKPASGIPASDIASGVIPDVSGKADKVQSATSGNFASLDSNGNLVDSGHKHSDYLTQHQDISGKADKVQNATSGNFTSLDANGNLTDSGKSASNFVSDVKMNGTSVLNQGVANIPKASFSTLGVIKGGTTGVGINNDGQIFLSSASEAFIKSGTNSSAPIAPNNQHISVFYGLAKAAGDSTQSASDNAVGTYTDDAKSAIKTMLDVVGNTDYATSSTAGISIIDPTNGIGIESQHKLYINFATSDLIKSGIGNYRPITPPRQHESVFYGLAKSAGDTTQSSSSNTVGIYTDSAKDAIKSMLGIDLASGNIQNVSGTTVTITGEPNARYICGEVATITITPPATGTIIVRFTSGSTAAVLTLPSTVKMPVWFDSTSLETDTIYELSITDGVYGTVMLWAV